MERWRGRVALVTGASVGIGAAITKTLVSCGMKVVGCARNVEKIQKLSAELKDKPGSLKAVKCDLTEEEDILAMFKKIRSDPDLGGVDVCINNAGLCHGPALLTGPTKDWKEMLDVNVLALCICTRESFKSMQERGVDDGHIVLMNSMGGHRVLKSGHFEAATKFAVSAILEGLRCELREIESHIRVTSVSAGMVETEYAFRKYKDDEKAKAFYSSIKCLQAEDIANAVLYALRSPPHVQVQDILIRPIEQEK